MNNLFNQPSAQLINQNNQQPFDPAQFQRLIPNLNNNMLQQLVQQARAQGISENKIQEGINYINSLR